MLKKIPYKNYFLTAIVLQILLLAAVILIRPFLPPLVPLFYGKPYGQEQLSTPLGLLIPSVISLFITFINIFISVKVKDSFLKKISAISAIILSLLTAITVIKIILLVGFF